MEFSTYDAPHDNADGECLAQFKHANWHNGIDGDCNNQSVNGLYKGKYFPHSKYNSVMYWGYETPLKTIQLMVRPAA